MEGLAKRDRGLRVAYFSPLNPIRSGISDFSEELLGALRNHVTLDLFVLEPPESEAIRSLYRWYILEDIYKPEIRAQYDVLVYHVGNNPAHHTRIIQAAMTFPGVVEMHDYALHTYLALQTLERGDERGYLAHIRACHGDVGVRMVTPYLQGLCKQSPWEMYSQELPANRLLLEASKAVIVHSDTARQMTKAIAPGKPVACIRLHSEALHEAPDAHQITCRQALGLDSDKLLFGSFGFATRSKRLEPTLRALQHFRDETHRDFCYIIVGKVEGMDIDCLLDEMNLRKHVLVAGYTALDKFKQYMGACDFCLNLRYPTQGESSGSVHRMLSMGKPVIVTKIGAFCEYPDEIALKVGYGETEVEDIYRAIRTLADAPEQTRLRGKQAVLYAREHCDLQTNAALYARFFADIAADTWQEEGLDLLADELESLGLHTEAEIRDYLRANPS